MIYLTHSNEETKQLAKILSQQFKNKGGVIALFGVLGVGKTTFVQGFAQGLGVKDKIISPTFILIRQHPLPGRKRLLYHIDLYRLEDSNQINRLGLKEIFSRKKDVILIEWSEKIINQLPPDHLKVKITKYLKDDREIEIV